MRYLIYLILSFIMQIVAWLVTPVLPLFAVRREGWSDNKNDWRVEPRLPLWLTWFDTPDNSLYGDKKFLSLNNPSYLSEVKWLYRNSIYGFKWSVLAADCSEYKYTVPKPQPNYKGPVFGSFYLKAGKYWQYKLCKKLTSNYCLLLNLGWLLDDVENNKKCLFMFSPRIKQIQVKKDTT